MQFRLERELTHYSINAAYFLFFTCEKRMQEYKVKFIEFVIANNILTFGSFTLKSGRISPYFFNAGLFNTGKLLSQLGEFYSDALVASQLEHDVLFGPAYKGIPLVGALAMNLFQKHGIDKPFSFNRKEQKNHGEGGIIVGSALKGDILVVDDVITAGTAIRESVAIIKSNNANLKGVLIALDRQEKGKDTDSSAIQQVEQEYGIKVICIVSLSDIVTYLTMDTKNKEMVESIRAYQQQYGI